LFTSQKSRLPFDNDHLFSNEYILHSSFFLKFIIFHRFHIHHGWTGSNKAFELIFSFIKTHTI
uniref:Ovule protein n=1 Tax=Haemonchus placei TaxID=6290 RepID=A0A0N4X7F5_HAEPC